MNWHITHYATHEILTLGVSDNWFNAALDVLKSQGSDAWHVFYYGA